MVEEKVINLRIITPNNRIIERRNCFSIKLPGLFGVFEILPEHENCMFMLRSGIISISTKKEPLSRFIISTSILKFSKNSICEIMSEFVTDILSVKNIKKSYIDIKIKGSSSNTEKDFYQTINSLSL